MVPSEATERHFTFVTSSNTLQNGIHMRVAYPSTSNQHAISSLSSSLPPSLAPSLARSTQQDARNGDSLVFPLPFLLSRSFLFRLLLSAHQPSGGVSPAINGPEV